jgi:hypothetical protein
MRVSLNFLQELVHIPVVLERAAPRADEIQQVGAIKVLPIGHRWPAIANVFIIVGGHSGRNRVLIRLVIFQSRLICLLRARQGKTDNFGS